MTKPKRSRPKGAELLARLKSDKRLRLVLLLLVSGIALLLLATPRTKQETKTENPQNLESADAYTERFAREMEANLAAAIGSIKGAGETRVFVTIETGARYVYAENRTSRADTEYGNGVSESVSSDTSYIVIDGADGEQPVVLYRIEPVVQGVVVVCKGGGDIHVKQAVVELVTTACGIGSNRVSVSEMS